MGWCLWFCFVFKICSVGFVLVCLVCVLLGVALGARLAVDGICRCRAREWLHLKLIGNATICRIWNRFMHSKRNKRVASRAVGALATSFALLLGTACVGEGVHAPDEPIEVGVDGVDIDNLPPAMASETIYEASLPNGNLITFFAYEDGSVSVQEKGLPNRNAIGSLPEFHGASPLELFKAVVPEGEEPPAELVENHLLVEAQRAELGLVSPVPDDFHVAELEGFDSELPPTIAFNSCTNNAAWMNHVGNSPIGSNCPGAAGKSWYACWTNFALPDVGDCAGTACTKYFTAGYNQVRASACARSGSGSVRFVMGSKPDVGGSYSTWFDHSLSTGS